MDAWNPNFQFSCVFHLNILFCAQVHTVETSGMNRVMPTMTFTSSFTSSIFIIFCILTLTPLTVFGSWISISSYYGKDPFEFMNTVTIVYVPETKTADTCIC